MYRHSNDVASHYEASYSSSGHFEQLPWSIDPVFTIKYIRSHHSPRITVRQWSTKVLFGPCTLYTLCHPVDELYAKAAI